jgi:hypothetical protein
MALNFVDSLINSGQVKLAGQIILNTVDHYVNVEPDTYLATEYAERWIQLLETNPDVDFTSLVAYRLGGS